MLASTTKKTFSSKLRIKISAVVMFLSKELPQQVNETVEQSDGIMEPLLELDRMSKPTLIERCTPKTVFGATQHKAFLNHMEKKILI
eukprot:snap_masked-scaffold_5-processed-gene-16.41-mRNA-1 protein AED:1.00 eAED:1.00 QI:0/-1/0/0/-1/1/1/0/86